jgi:hypothetical protein
VSFKQLKRGMRFCLPSGQTVQVISGTAVVVAFTGTTDLGFIRAINTGDIFTAPISESGIRFSFALLALTEVTFWLESGNAGLVAGFVDRALYDDFGALAARLAVSPSARVGLILEALNGGLDAPLVVSRALLAELSLASESCVARTLKQRGQQTGAYGVLVRPYARIQLGCDRDGGRIRLNRHECSRAGQPGGMGKAGRL